MYELSYDRWVKIRSYHIEKFNDAVRKDAVDKDILPMLNTINSNIHFVTRSSCYGRILIIREDGIPKKGRDVVVGKYHRPVEISLLKRYLDKYDDELWINIESTIVHVASDSLSYAYKLLKVAYKSGYLASSIYSISRRGVTIEILERRKKTVLLTSKKNKYFINENILNKLHNYIMDMFRDINIKMNLFITLFKDNF